MEKKESRETEGGSRGIQHLSHNHRLTLDEDNKAGGVLCYGCLQPISSGSSVYTCTPCYFFLHKFCAELPEKLTMHPFHVEHQLSLLPRSDHYENYYICDICRQVRPTEFSYYCDSCKFYVDIKCASIKIKTQQQPMELIEHDGHKHKLIPIEKSSNLLCDDCGRKHEGSSSYLCIECRFWVNRKCPFLPTAIRLSNDDRHRDHYLSLSLTESTDAFPIYSCKICSKSIYSNQWYYYCCYCNDGSSVHIKCRPVSSDSKIQHWSHNHPLILEEDNELAAGAFCDGCLQPISSGPVYACILCQFFLHKFCAELPREITHPFHSEHQLYMFPRANRSTDTNRYTCDICRQERPTEFSYSCDLCNFFVDIKCASIMFKIKQPMEMEHGSHKHKLIPIEKSVNLSCDVCARKHEGSSSYLCVDCGFWVNQECAFLPTTIQLNNKNHHHEHDLTLIRSIPYEYYKDSPSCQICLESVFRNQWVYFCLGCRYFVHIKCSPVFRDGKTEIVTKKFRPNLPQFPWAGERPEEFANLVALLIKNIAVSSSQGEKATDGQEPLNISHIHDHKPLIFSATLPINECDGGSCSSTDASKQPEIRQCNACWQTISTSFYYCAKPECNFFIRKWCAELPKELDHSCHSAHPLRLMKPQEVPNNCNCQFCDLHCDTFYFGCRKCHFYLDVKCAGIPSGINHKSHNHSLALRSFSSCSICASEAGHYAFVCEACIHKVCVRCALLPGKVSHRYDKHPFTLTYSPPPGVKDKDEVKDEEKIEEFYYCEICEDDINLKHWFYHCITCDQSLHIKCICPNIDPLYSSINL